MDAHTLELLEWTKLTGMIADYAGSKPGKRRANALMPSTDRETILENLGRTTEMVDAVSARLIPPISGLRDVELHLRRINLGVLLDVASLLELKDFFELAGRVHEYGLRLDDEYPKLQRLTRGVKDWRPLAKSIDRVIDDRSRVRDDASTELKQIRRELAHYEDRIQAEMKRMLRSEDIRKALRFPQPTLCGDHHVLPVAVNHRHKIPGVVHRTSSTGETLYIEPSKVAEIGAEASVLRSAEEREVRRVLRRLCDAIRKDVDGLTLTLDTLAELDFLLAKAQFSIDYQMTCPEIVANQETRTGALHFPNARHPLLESLFRLQSTAENPKQVVPVSVHLGGEFDLLIVTGPNTGGKTVALKTVGLLVLMAQSGLHVPTGRGAKMPIFDEVLADIGDEQSLEQSLSTFSAHMTRIAEILRRSGPRTLVLIDELGAGTEPSEGAALGRAILDELRTLECRAMVTTHLNDLKTYALNAARTENAAMEFDPNTLSPTYRLLVGQIGQSCAIKIARRLKLPPELLKRAKRYLHRRRGSNNADMRKLQEIRQEAEAARERALASQIEADALARELRLKSENLRQEAEVSMELEKARQALQPGDTVRVARFGRAGIIKRVDVRKRQAAVDVGAVEWQLPLDELIPQAAK